MTLAWIDRACPSRTYVLPRQAGEDRVTYARRFFASLRGLGNVAFATVRGSRRRVRGTRSL